jgi:hypothetical protein
MTSIAFAPHLQNPAPLIANAPHRPPLLQSTNTDLLENQIPDTPEAAPLGAMGMTLSMLCMLSNRRRRAAANAHHFTS